MRSAISQIAGMHLQGGISRDIIRQYGLKNWTVLHQQADIIQTIKEEIPDAVVCLRMYDSDWRAVNAYEQGGKAFAYAVQFLRPTDMITPANEQNIEKDRVVQSAADYMEIRDWNAAFIAGWNDACAAAGFRPARTCTPALSPGHSEDQEDFPGVIGFQILKSAWDQFDVIGVHCYFDPPGSAQLYDPNLSQYYAFRNVRTARIYYPNKTQWWGEFNGGAQAVFNPTLQLPLALDCRYLFAQTAVRYPYVEGVTYFLDESWDQPYQARRMPPVFNEFCRIGHEEALIMPDVPFLFAFADYAASHPEVGKGRSELIYPSVAQPSSSSNLAVQGTTTGLLVWDGSKVIFIKQQ